MSLKCQWHNHEGMKPLTLFVHVSSIEIDNICHYIYQRVRVWSTNLSDENCHRVMLPAMMCVLRVSTEVKGNGNVRANDNRITYVVWEDQTARGGTDYTKYCRHIGKNISCKFCWKIMIYHSEMSDPAVVQYVWSRSSVVCLYSL